MIEIEDGMGFAGHAPPSLSERRAEERERLRAEITYKGFVYNMRSQRGIDSLRKAIERDRTGSV
jgi:hypothetical protein